MQWKRFATAVLFFLPVLAGCSTSTPQQLPHQDTTLGVACPGYPVDAAVEAYGRVWAVRHNAHIRIIPYDASQGPKENLAADVWVVRPAQLPHLASANLLHPLPSLPNAFDLDDLLPQFKEPLLRWGNPYFGLPILGEAPVCVFRSDRVADQAAQAAFAKKHGRPLAAPATWEDFVDIAEFFNDNMAPSLPCLPAGSDDLDREFYTLAACYVRHPDEASSSEDGGPADDVFAFHYDLKTGRPRIYGPGFVHALQLLRRLQACRPPGTSPSPAEAFRDGKAILCLTDASWIQAFQEKDKSAVRDRFAVCPMPGSRVYFDFNSGAKVAAPGNNRVPYLGAGGWLGVVPRSAAHPEAAFALLAELAGPDVSRQIVIEPRWGGGAIRREQVKSPSVHWESFDLDPTGTRALTGALEQTLLHPRVRNPVIKMRTPDAAERQQILIAELRKALDGKAEPAVALRTVADRWEKVDAARGPAALVDYHISVGLRTAKPAH